MCPATGLTEFARKCIDNVTRDHIAEPVLLILAENFGGRRSIGAKIRESIQRGENLWHLQTKLFPPSRIEAFRPQPLDECLPGIERIACQPELKGKWSQYFRAGDVAEIQSRNLDFILKFAYGIIRGEILQAARYGVWSFHHGDEEKYRGRPPGFWEIYHGDPMTGALLQRLTDRLDGGIVLKKCFVSTNGVSFRANLQRIKESSWHMVRWACLDAIRGDLSSFQAAPSRTVAPISRAPNDLQMMRFWMRLTGNWFRRKLASQRVDQSNVGVVNEPQQKFLDPEFTPTIEWSAYKGYGQMVADPFLIPDQYSVRILVKEFNWPTEKGRISELRGRGTEARVTPVIDEGRHMSYPYVFSHDGAIYAIPECSESKSILLYRLDEPTGTWRRQTTLIDDVDAVKTTVFQYGELWWLMHSGSSGCGPWSLYLWHSHSLLGPWCPHVANPVKTDVSCTRPAGNPFRHEGCLYRPAQDGRTGYSGRLCINCIQELNLNVFRETVVRRIAPNPQSRYPHGLHTLSGYGRLSLVDGTRHTWPLRLFHFRQRHNAW